MPECKLNIKLRKILNVFVENIKNAFKENLVSVILYGSASSGEFIDKHSDINVLVVLKSIDLANLKMVSGLINKPKFRLIQPLFFTEGYIRSSTDVFPIEFLDMKENYTVLAGVDILKDLVIDLKNLRFQCEQELRVKLIALRQFYLSKNKDKSALSDFLFKSFNSIMHILRNVLRLKGEQPPYLKQDILNCIAAEFHIDKDTWVEILSAKNKQKKLNRLELERLFINFVGDLEGIINVIDRL